MSATRTLRRPGLAAAFTLLYGLSFPFQVGEFGFDAGLLFGWLALVPFALLLRGLSIRAAFAWATAAGTGAFSIVLFWIWVVVAVHGGAHPVVAVGAVFALAAANALHLAAAAALVVALAPHAGRARVLLLPAAWLVLEHLRGVAVFGGFPWAFLGHSAHANGPLRELAALAGVSGLSFLLACFASLLAERRWRTALGLLAGAHALGFALLLARVEPAPADAPLVAIVQGNIPQGVKWNPEYAADAIRAHLETSRLAAAAGDLALIVWPEAAVPAFLEHEPAYLAEIQELARETGAALLIGAPALESVGGADQYRFFNSAYAFTPQGEAVDRYDKARLVPFGEYVPLRAVLGLFVSGIATGAATSDLTPGPGPRAFTVPGFEDGHALAPLICYEVLYPGLVRRAVLQGARVLVNITNDAWYGRTSGPQQFVAIAALRSAEHGLPMIRAANTGVSAIVDAGGLVLEHTPVFERRALVAPLPPARPGLTMYTRLGDWVVWLAWAGLIACGGAGLVRRRGDSRDRGRASGSQ